MNGDNQMGRERMAQANQRSIVLLEARAREFKVVASSMRRETDYPQRRKAPGMGWSFAPSHDFETRSRNELRVRRVKPIFRLVEARNQ